MMMKREDVYRFAVERMLKGEDILLVCRNNQEAEYTMDALRRKYLVANIDNAQADFSTLAFTVRLGDIIAVIKRVTQLGWFMEIGSLSVTGTTYSCIGHHYDAIYFDARCIWEEVEYRIRPAALATCAYTHF